jgi:DHA2 family multidrug resistance protein
VRAATLRYYEQLGNQTRLLAFMDCFHIIAVITLLAAPLVFLTRNFRVGGKSPEGH